MRRVPASIKVGRWGKKISKTASKGEGPREEPGQDCRECPQERKAQSRRSRNFTNLPRWKGARRELGQDPRRGSDALRLPEALREDLRPGGERATHRGPAP